MENWILGQELMVTTAPYVEVEAEAGNGVATQADGVAGGSNDAIADDFVIEADHYVVIDFDVKIALGVKIGFGEKTDRDDIDAEADADA